ncbi:Na+/H+ antiporter subunit E [Natronospira bacteriovora]|uniref:Na+/H+ antiporter subunit E n=1 Tax=Natronospira bacteriovora TaxID=3069753 RepID=A0ABU0W9H1_9GAMM|nr:Na+/H+ antiporter subunit E [Natronospira sp. AB-CW4]MDQ2070687.1 Na+/H+ antiporter subunit E [Natronospira sp. AB-CW4]
MFDRIAANIPLAAVLMLLWFGLSGNQGWLFGTAAVLCALLVTNRLLHQDPERLSLAGLLRFSAWFVSRSFLGGLDVAWRALSPGKNIDNALFTHRFKTANPSARTVVIGALSLMPGTLSVAVEDDHLTVHSIAGDVHGQVESLEALAIDIFRPEHVHKGSEAR